MSAPQLHIETPEDTAEADALVARAFGPGRFAKTADRLREGRMQRLDLCVVARIDGRLVGCVRQWPILVGDTEALLLGPIAVDEAFRSHGLGAALVRQACAIAEGAGYDHILLVGDLAFFGPLGFAVARDAILPGPVDPRRVLARGPLTEPAIGGVVIKAKLDPTERRPCSAPS
jgi:predicted N-acetyltransferase YhbS